MERPLILKEKEDYNRIDGYDWSVLQEAYAENSIDKIIDKAGAGIKRRVTSYPTPLARMHFFEDAFQYVVDSNVLNDDTIFHEAVSHCLDVWEILFNYEAFKEKLNIKNWDFSAINELIQSNDNGHRILGKSLDLFLKQDKTIQLKETIDKIYLLSYDGYLFAGSSPFSGFFTVDFDKDAEGNVDLPFEIKIPGSANLNYFESIRSIDKRDEEFQEYLFKLIKSQTEIEKYFTFFYKYIFNNVKQTDEIKRIKSEGNPDFILLEYDAVINVAEHKNKKIEIPSYENIEFDKEKLSLLNITKFRDKTIIEYSSKKIHLEQQVGIQVKKRKIKIATNCDFIIDTKNEELKNKKVLALRQNPDDKTKKYIGTYWDNDIKVKHYHPESNWEKNRKIPSWNIEHPFLVMNDLLEEYLIELPYNINTRAFITCSDDNSHYLLPIKPLYFKFFTITDLVKHLKIEKTGEGNNQKIVANLTIPLINDNKITFTRVYDKSNNFRSYKDIHSSAEGKGHIVEYELGLMLFPFLKTDKPEFNDFYKVACIDGNFNIDKEAELYFFDQNNIEPIVESDNRLKVETRVEKLYGRKNIAGSKYYQITGNSFDYIQAEISVEEQSKTIKGLIIPTWYGKGYPIQNDGKFTFAVDFGTTNSHIAYKKGGIKSDITPKPFVIKEENLQIERLDMPTARSHVSETEKFDYKHKDDADFIDRIVRKQRNEFIPSIIGEVYSSPFRTAMSQTKTKSVAKGSFDLFGNINIAFALNKRFEENLTWKIHTNLKWNKDIDNQERVELFIKEILYLIRTKVIKEEGNPEKTKIYWFSPLNMAPPIFNNLSKTWTKSFKEIFNTDNEAISISESEAPFYDKLKDFGNDEVLSIDIGGMTTDVLYITSKEPIFGSSFSFAGNALYGDFPETGTSKENGFIRAFKANIKNNIEAARDNTRDKYKENRYKEALLAYEWYFKQDEMNSEDIISFFYSDEKFGFADILKNSYDFKIVFILHYAGIIYHCAQLIEDSDNVCPGDIYFSGNGSLMFQIIDADTDLLGRIAQKIFEKVLGSSTDITIHLSEKPKEASCNGALKSGLFKSQKPSLELKHIHIGENINWGNNSPAILNKPTYKEIQKVRKNFEPEKSEYYKFIDLFFELYKDPKFDFETNFGIKLNVKNLKAILKNDKDTAAYHYKGTNWQIGKGSNIETPITETVFFYPLMGGINKLLNELANRMKGAESEL